MAHNLVPCSRIRRQKDIFMFAELPEELFLIDEGGYLRRMCKFRGGVWLSQFTGKQIISHSHTSEEPEVFIVATLK